MKGINQFGQISPSCGIPCSNGNDFLLCQRLSSLSHNPVVRMVVALIACLSMERSYPYLLGSCLVTYGPLCLLCFMHLFIWLSLWVSPVNLCAHSPLICQWVELSWDGLMFISSLQSPDTHTYTHIHIHTHKHTHTHTHTRGSNALYSEGWNLYAFGCSKSSL